MPRMVLGCLWFRYPAYMAYPAYIASPIWRYPVYMAIWAIPPIWHASRNFSPFPWAMNSTCPTLRIVARAPSRRAAPTAATHRIRETPVEHEMYYFVEFKSCVEFHGDLEAFRRLVTKAPSQRSRGQT
eukprot:SAG11_NODE_1579_length_4652_cov_5.253459_4_plen_128_part_00